MAYGCLPLLVRALPPVRDRAAVAQPLALHAGMEWRVLGFALAAALASAVLCGILPALRSSRANLSGSRVTARLFMRNAMVAAQVAVCTILLIGAALLVETLDRMRTMDAGFDADHVVTFTVDPSMRAYKPEQSRALSLKLLEKARALPMARSAALAGKAMMRGTGLKATFGAAGTRITKNDFLNSSMNSVSPGYFETMGMRVITGRDFTWFDRNGKNPPSMKIVNQAFARRFFPGRNPLGMRFGGNGADGLARPDDEVVGVVSDAKYRSLREPIQPVVYNSAVDGFDDDFILHVRTRGRPEAVIAPVRDIMRSLDPELPFVEVETLRQEVDTSLWQERLLADAGVDFRGDCVAVGGHRAVWGARFCGEIADAGDRSAGGVGRGAGAHREIAFARDDRDDAAGNRSRIIGICPSGGAVSAAGLVRGGSVGPPRGRGVGRPVDAGSGNPGRRAADPAGSARAAERSVAGGVTNDSVLCHSASLAASGWRLMRRLSGYGIGLTIASHVQMLRGIAALLIVFCGGACAQSSCAGGVNFLTARTVNLKPSATSHIDVVRQSDGSYTGFEVTDAAPYRLLATTPHFEKQLSACLPHVVFGSPSTTPPVANPPGAGSQLQVSTTLASGNLFVANIGANGATIHFDIFDSRHNLLSEANFSYLGSTNDIFSSLALADLNGDGKLDLIAAFYTGAGALFDGGIWTFPGNGDGTFQAGKRQVQAAMDRSPLSLSVAVGDLNGDGKLDLVLGATNADAPLLPFIIALGNGDGTFKQIRPLAVLSEFGLAAIADLNGDGKADLVLPAVDQQGAPAIAIALGNGDGTFQSATYYPASLNPAPLHYYAPLLLSTVAVGDVDGRRCSRHRHAWRNDSVRRRQGRISLPEGICENGASGSVMIADFDGDGKMDIILGNGNATFLSGNAIPSLTVLFGAGGGAFIAAPITEFASLPNSNGPVVASGDFNGDGVPDLVLARSLTSTLQLNMLLGRGNGEFAAEDAQSFAQSSELLVWSAITADFNRDGKADLAVLMSAEKEGEVQIYPGHGDGTLGAPLTFTVPDEFVDFIAAPDVNGDGIPDLVVTGRNAVFVWLGKGDGTFSSPTFTANASSPAIAFGDFNGDGKLDIAMISGGAASVSVLLGKGDGTFPNFVQSALPAGAAGGIVVADFDGDGRLDLAVPLNNGSELRNLETAVLFGDGHGKFPVVHSFFSQIVCPSPIRALDMNGDKIPDLIGQFIGGAEVCLGDGDGYFGVDELNFPGQSPLSPTSIGTVRPIWPY